MAEMNESKRFPEPDEKQRTHDNVQLVVATGIYFIRPPLASLFFPRSRSGRATADGTETKERNIKKTLCNLTTKAFPVLTVRAHLLQLYLDGRSKYPLIYA